MMSSAHSIRSHRTAKKDAITKERLEALFDLPLNEAAEACGVCPAYFKTLCRERGIPHWPYRQVHKLSYPARIDPCLLLSG